MDNSVRLSRLPRLALLLSMALPFSACNSGPAAEPLIEGDPWAYNLTLEDMPPKFEQDYFDLESGVVTNRDVALTENDPALFAAANAQGRRFGHFVEFTGSDKTTFNHVGALIVTYSTAEGAAAGLAEGLPGLDLDTEWTEVPNAEKIGDESRLYVMSVPDLETVYRLDYRFRNARVSVGVSGPPPTMPNPQPAYDFARLLLDRLTREAVPQPLAALRAAGLDDLRGLAVSQEDLIELDPVNGIVWYYDDDPLPQWVGPPEGAAAGYQISFYRPVGREDVESRLPYTLVITVLGYPKEDDARAALAGAVGPTNGQKVPLAQAGEESVGFYRKEVTNYLGETQYVSIYEIDLRQGRYVAGVRVLAFEPLDANPLDPNPATDFLHTFARRQAERLAAAR